MGMVIVMVVLTDGGDGGDGGDDDDDDDDAIICHYQKNVNIITETACTCCEHYLLCMIET